jgi:hypothetical protein
MGFGGRAEGSCSKKMGQRLAKETKKEDNLSDWCYHEKGCPE